METDQVNPDQLLMMLERDALRAINWEFPVGIAPAVDRQLNGLPTRCAIELKSGGNPDTSFMGYFKALYWINGRAVTRYEALGHIATGHLPAPKRGPGRPRLRTEEDLAKEGLMVRNGQVVPKPVRKF